MINVLDIFAGPGGLGEGFSAYRLPGKKKERVFKLRLSAEMEASAHKTLTLRAFYRSFENKKNVPKSYYAHMLDPAVLPYDASTEKFWEEAKQEALQLELGKRADNNILEAAICERVTASTKPWILIGGPPCQAYSLIGRSRNKGKKDYQPEKDKRHFLYREYLKILEKHRPDAFVMENVKGILSSKVGENQIFSRILEDLSAPSLALGKASGCEYDIVPMAKYDDSRAARNDPSRFLIYPERHGIPQARHRVIMLGIRKGSGLTPPGFLPLVDKQATLREALLGMPMLRSGLSKKDSDAKWHDVVEAARKSLINELCRDCRYSSTIKILKTIKFKEQLGRESLRNNLHAHRRVTRNKMPKPLRSWLLDSAMTRLSNHDSRGHMPTDLERYLFAAAFAKANKGRSPTSDYFPSFLAPNHKSWKKGGFKDRFKVQAYNSPSGTVTSHIAKDGHHFIHPDPAQCRSLTVREAARLQTFPDNYFFEGNRTEQYTQVGNAVPPLLAHGIAKLVAKMFA